MLVFSFPQKFKLDKVKPKGFWCFALWRNRPLKAKSKLQNVKFIARVRLNLPKVIKKNGFKFCKVSLNLIKSQAKICKIRFKFKRKIVAKGENLSLCLKKNFAKVKA